MQKMNFNQLHSISLLTHFMETRITFTHTPLQTEH